MARRQKTVEIAKRRREIADKYLRGVTQWDIAIELGVNQSTISRDLQALQKEWLASSLANLTQAKALELAKVDRLEREYWDAWERSKRTSENSITERIDGDIAKIKVLLAKESQVGDPRFLAGVEKCINKRCEILGLDAPKRVEPIGDIRDGSAASAIILSADLIASPFIDVHRDIKERRHMEYLLKGGRGSTKSSFTSLEFIILLVNNPGVHGLAMRQVANTLRDSVYSQLVWAISMLGLDDKFKCISSPLEITYIPTGQKIFFRGADMPEKIKSIKPSFGHIGILWFEELDQFHGPEAIRKIEQSVLRGGEEAWNFKTYNPPRSTANWVNKYAQIPKENQYQHHSTYLDVPVEWLGQTFTDEAEHLKNVNPKSYEHEYLGVANGTGGTVFENIVIRKITDEEVSQFDHVLHGLDWGYFPDPAAYVRCHYDPARLRLYIFGELRAQKMGNPELYRALVNMGLTSEDTIIADSAEPKSIADFRAYSSELTTITDSNGNFVLVDGMPLEIFGPSCRGAEKGPESVKYSIKWLQSLTEIVIDNQRAPYSAEEFLNYELEQDKDGNFISEYPDRNNHFIDGIRYATNLIWRRRGQ